MKPEKNISRSPDRLVTLVAGLYAAALPATAWAIPSPDLIINLSASVAQLAGLLSVVLGGVVVSGRRVKDATGNRAPNASNGLRWAFRLCVVLFIVSVFGNVMQHTRSVDEKNQRMQTNLLRPSIENGQRVGDVTLKTLSFSEQTAHPLGIETADLAMSLQTAQGPLLIDVREDGEVATGRIAGAKHIRYPDLGLDPAQLDAAGGAILLCHSGNRSSELCEELNRQGKQCRFVVGGYEKWIAEGRALDTDAQGTREELRSIPDFVNKDTLLDTSTVLELITRDQVTIVDVRYPAEFDKGHLPNAVNIPMRRMPSAKLAAALGALPDKPALSVCYDRRSCFYAQLVGLRLSKLGIDFRGRYTTPHEFLMPRKEKAFIGEWQRAREGDTLFAMASAPLRDALDWLREHSGHYVIAILALVLGLRLMMLPLAWKADRDQRVQKSLSGEVTKLREKHAGDGARVSKSIMALYRKHRLRPLLNACSSMFQLLLFIVFFSVVERAAAGWNESFLWLQAAGKPDALFILPALVGTLFSGFLAATLRRRGKKWTALYLVSAVAMGALAGNLNVAVNLYLILSLSFLLVQLALFGLLWDRAGDSATTAGGRRQQRDAAIGIVPLAEADRHPEAGQKAARLAKIMRAGLKVPDGFVLTYDVVKQGRDPQSGEWRFTRPQHTAFKRLWRRLKVKHVAVRSSGVNEDGVKNSYAGVFESVLGVTRDQLGDALEKVSASLNSEISDAYGASSDEKGGALVQCMVDAEYAGVLFTEHPASAGCSMVELVQGLGDALVSGRVTPKSYRFGRLSGEAMDREAAPIDLTPLLELGRQLEELFQGPQDVEWAYADGEFVLLQARDITSRAGAGEGQVSVNEQERARVLSLLGNTDDYQQPVLFQNELSELLPNPTLLSSSLMERLWSADGSTDIACRMLGIPYDVREDSPPYVVTVYGALYVNRSEERRRLRRGPGFAAAFRLARAAEAIEADFREGFLPPLRRQMRMDEALDLSCFSTDELLSLFERWSEQFVTETYVQAEIVNLATDFYWKTACQKLAKNGQDPAVLLANPAETVVSRAMALLSVSAQGQSHVREFLALFGHRAPADYELSQPRYSESPELLIRQAARARQTRPASRSGVQLPADPMLRLAVDRARRFQVLKEEAKHHCLRQLALVRRVLVELDQRLALDGGIFHLHIAELPGMLDEARAAELRALIGERAAAENIWRQVRLPTDLSVRDLESLEPLKAPVAVPGDGALAGTKVSGAGDVVGRVRVLHDAAEVSALKDGEIVVARLTDPSWYPLFARAGGVVTEVGGWLSHAAIVAREFNLTAVVGVRQACDLLQTGDLVRLHADGRVERVSERRKPKLVPASDEHGQASGSTAA